MWLNEVSPGAVDASSRTPMHSQVSAIIRSRISDGELPPGSSLPTEAELQERFGISRSVVRQALAALTAEGLIKRGRGRGSVVAPRGEHHRLVQRMSGLSTQIAAEGAQVTTEVLHLAPERNAHAEAALASAAVLGIRRLRSVGNEPIALIHTWLPLSLGERLSADDLTHASLHAVMRGKLGVSIASGRRQVRAVPASAALAQILGVAVGAPVLLLEGTSLNENGLPIEVFSTWHRADRVVFDIDVLGDGPDAVQRAPERVGEGPEVVVGAVTGAGTGAGAVAAVAASGREDLAGRARALALQLQQLSEDLER